MSTSVKNNWLQRHYALILILAFLVTLNGIFYYVGPGQIVDVVGVDNTYLYVFLLAAIGGLSTLSGTVLYSSLITFAAGGVSPLLLGFAAGVGLFISDSIFFFLAKRGTKSVPASWQPWLTKWNNLVTRYPRWAVILFIFFLLGFTPMPNDVLMIILALTGFTYRELILAFLGGSLCVALIATHFGSLLT